MALGFDLLVAVAEVCIEKEIPFVAAIPCQNQTKLWPGNEKKKYKEMMSLAWKSKVVSPGPFEIWKLFERNKWIVKRSNIFLSYWDGIPKGGTYSTIKVAEKDEMVCENLFPICDAWVRPGK